jgi:hypothetical protein
MADRFGAGWAIGAVAALTFLSGTAAAAVMRETLSRRMPTGDPTRRAPRFDSPGAGS